MSSTSDISVGDISRADAGVAYAYPLGTSFGAS
jgi:hypothetical protein